MLIDCGIQLFLALIGALPEIISTILDALPTIVESIINGLLSMIPQLVEAGIKLFVAIVQNLPTIIVEIVKAIPQIITGIVKSFASFIPKMAECGLNLIKGLWNGMKDAGEWLWEKISGLFDGIVDRIKDFFGIHSPSKLFENVIGKNLVLGLAVGIDENSHEATESISKMQDDIMDAIDAQEMVAHVRTAVDSTQGEYYNAAVTSKNSAGAHSEADEDDGNGDEENGENSPKFIDNQIIIDGKEAARVITPYVEKELAWRKK